MGAYPGFKLVMGSDNGEGNDPPPPWWVWLIVAAATIGFIGFMVWMAS